MGYLVAICTTHFGQGPLLEFTFCLPTPALSQENATAYFVPYSVDIGKFSCGRHPPRMFLTLLRVWPIPLEADLIRLPIKSSVESVTPLNPLTKSESLSRKEFKNSPTESRIALSFVGVSIRSLWGEGCGEKRNRYPSYEVIHSVSLFAGERAANSLFDSCGHLEAFRVLMA